MPASETITAPSDTPSDTSTPRREAGSAPNRWLILVIACLASLPVSNEISLPSTSTDTRVTASDIFNFPSHSALRSAELLSLLFLSSER